MPPDKCANVGTPEALIVNTWPSVEDDAVVNAEVPCPNKTPLFVNVVAPVPPLATPNVPDVICEAAIAIDVAFAELIRPFASNLKLGTTAPVPKSPAVIEMFVKSVLAWANAALAYDAAELAVANAELPYEPAAVAVALAVFATPKAALAYVPEFTAFVSAVAAFVVAVFAWPYAELA